MKEPNPALTGPKIKTDKKTLKKIVAKLEKIAKSQSHLKITDENDKNLIIQVLDEKLENFLEKFSEFDYFGKILEQGHYVYLEMMFVS